MSNEVSVGFIGNPNCGKTTLFNAYTGAHLKVANWPGVTVEKKEGHMTFHGDRYKLVDLPGIYSLTSYSMEELVSRDYILSDDVDVVVDVADASNLERNLYLTLQLIEMGKPVVLALNMMDIVAERGMEIDIHRLPEVLGIPVVPVSARKRTGLEVLMHAVEHHKDKVENVDTSSMDHHHKKVSHHHHDHHKEYTMVYSDEIEDKIDSLESLLHDHYPDLTNRRWHAIKMLEMDGDILKKYPLPEEQFKAIVPESFEKQLINEKYDFIEEIIEEVVMNRSRKIESTDRIDAFLTHPVLGMPIFFGIMAVVFFLTFTIGDWLAGGFEQLLGAFSDKVAMLLGILNVNEVLQSMILDGIIAGVGGILTFLPNIFILFLALAILEDSGYMSRVAYVMDSLMSKMGLSGKAFIPLLLGFGCSVPAVMASRTLEHPRDRLKTVLVTPFISCSARLPIYVLFSKLFFGKWATLAALSMYALGLLVAVVLSMAISALDRQKENNSLLIELPEYKTPNARTIAIYVWEKVKEYLVKAGTVIFVASVILWVILNFNFSGMTGDMADSFAASIGRVLVPVFAPIGLGYWQIAVALISGIAAKEVVVSSCSVLFGIANLASPEGIHAFADILSAGGFGPANAYAMMVFCLLYIPCAATIGTIKSETKSWKWAGISILLQLGVAWVMAFIVYHIGLMIV